MSAISSLIVISRPIILGGSVVIFVSVVGVEDGRGGVIVEWEIVVLIGVLVSTPGDMKLDELEILADIDCVLRCVVVAIVDWEVLIRLVITPGSIRLDELERLADIEGIRGGVTVDWETLIGLVTTPGGMRLDELE